METIGWFDPRSHAPRGNAPADALRRPDPGLMGRGASGETFPRGAWERGSESNHPMHSVSLPAILDVGWPSPRVRGLDFLLRTPPSGSICARSRQPPNPRGLRPNAFPLPPRSSHFLRHSTAGVYRAPHLTPPARPATERSQWQAGQAPRCSLPDVARAPLPEKTKPMASWVEPEDSRGIAERSSRNSTSRGRTKPTASWVDLPGRPTLCRAEKTKPMAIWERVPAPSPVGRAATERSQWRLG